MIRESYSIEFKHSLLWEAALGIAAITHKKITHSLTEQDFFDPIYQDVISIQLKTELDTVHTRNTWKALLQLLHYLDDHSLESFQTFVHSLNESELRRYCLPYLNQKLEETVRLAARGDAKAVKTIAAANQHIAFMPDYIEYICTTEIDPLKEHLISVMTGWFEELIHPQQHALQDMLCRDIELKSAKQKTYPSLDAFVQYVTDGVDYSPEPSVTKVVLIPHFSYRPWTIVADLKGTKVFYYPIANASINPFDPLIPDKKLALTYKALGDEARLKMVKLLYSGDKSLQELASLLDMPKSTLHHHLTQLRSARLVLTTKNKYSLNKTKLADIDRGLTDYLNEGWNESE
ncbi:metalloregulator ArsR/SmtB family transcription factor [Alkalihalobacillus sp. FSL W8-0930]